MRLITIARKPLPKGVTVAQNCLEHGCGGINVDGGRIATREDLGRANGDAAVWGSFGNGVNAQYGKPVEQQGRWPANAILEHRPECRQADKNGLEEVAAWECHPGCPVKTLDEQSGFKKDGIAVRHHRNGTYCHSSQRKPLMADMGHGGFGGASRFFKQVKGS